MVRAILFTRSFSCARENGGVEATAVGLLIDKPIFQLGDAAVAICGHPPEEEEEPASPLPGQELLRLSLSGELFVVSAPSVQNNSFGQGLLPRFAAHSHAQRLRMCDGFDEQDGAYFFARPAQPFHSILAFHTTGHFHTALNACTSQLVQELRYWGVGESALRCSCSSDLAQLLKLEKRFEGNASEQPVADAFDLVSCGSWRRSICAVTERPDSSIWAKLFAITSMFFILLSVGSLALSTVPDMQVDLLPDANATTQGPPMRVPHELFSYVERVCIAWFTFEYAVRVLAAPRRCKFVREGLNVVDMLAIVPFYIELLIKMAGVDAAQLNKLKLVLMVMRVLRILRVVRIFKLARYSVGMQLFALAMRKSLRNLGMMCVLVFTGVVFFSTVVYYVEIDYPHTHFTSIPAGFWWCLVTMTTVGYGDIVPQTTFGKLAGSGAIICGVIVLALPITIIVENFAAAAEELQEKRRLQQSVDALTTSIKRKRPRRNSSCKDPQLRTVL